MSIIGQAWVCCDKTGPDERGALSVGVALVRATQWLALETR